MDAPASSSPDAGSEDPAQDSAMTGDVVAGEQATCTETGQASACSEAGELATGCGDERSAEDAVGTEANQTDDTSAAISVPAGIQTAQSVTLEKVASNTVDEDTLTKEERERIEANRLKAVQRYNEYLVRKKEEASRPKVVVEPMPESPACSSSADTGAASGCREFDQRDEILPPFSRSFNQGGKLAAKTKPIDTAGHPTLAFSRKRPAENDNPNKKEESKNFAEFEETYITTTNKRGKVVTSRLFSRGGYFVAENC